jgi:hypothetical protein
MEVKINREIRDYTEAMFFGLSLRQLIFAVLAVLTAVGVYFTLQSHLGTETVSWVCVLCAAPFPTAYRTLSRYKQFTGRNISRQPRKVHENFQIRRYKLRRRVKRGQRGFQKVNIAD